MPTPPTDLAGIGHSIGQIALVVRDLDAALAHWTRVGIGPWRIYTFGPHLLQRMTFRGREQPYAMRLALAAVGSLNYELIQPVQGPNTYEEFLTTRGEGLHHLGYYVDDIDAAIAAMAAQGYPLLQSGHGLGLDGDGAYAYFDTERDFGCVLEAIRRPSRMLPPEVWFPAPPAA